MARIFHFLVIFTILSQLPAEQTNENNVEEHLSAYAEAASNLLRDRGMQDLGGMVNDFMQTENGKQLGNMFMGAMNNKEAVTQQILRGLGSMLNQKEGRQSIDPNMLGNIIGSAFRAGNKKSEANDNILGSIVSNVISNMNNKETGGIDMMSVLSLFGNFLNQGEGKGGQGLLSFLPVMMSIMGGTGDQETDGKSWLSPSLLEKLYSILSSFINSENGKTIVNAILGEKIVKAFADADGKFSAARTMELLENHSFRKHWIQMVTKKIASVVAYLANPETQRQFLKTTQYILNNFLKKQGFPRAAMFDYQRPSETITAMVNYGSKKYLDYPMSSKQYVKPAVEYVKDLFRIAQTKGILGSGIDSREFSDKLADTLNLEIIEPVIRVYRAYRFVKKYPKCDRYVFCLINQDNPNDPVTLPGLRKGLSRATSLLVSWLVAKHSGTSYWTLYDIITEDKHNCKANYLPACNDFHVEEAKVTTEYVLHTEL